MKTIHISYDYELDRVRDVMTGRFVNLRDALGIDNDGS